MTGIRRFRRLAPACAAAAALLLAACSSKVSGSASPDFPAPSVGAASTTPSGSPSPSPTKKHKPDSTATSTDDSDGKATYSKSAKGASAQLVAYFGSQFGTKSRLRFSKQMFTVESDPTVGNFLHVLYPAGSTAPSSGKSGGAQIMVPFANGPVDDATLTYQLRFPAGFTWVQGGKLPGLCGGTCNTGGKDPNGVNGWSARFMWRTGGAGQVYAYLATTRGYGTQLGTGNWHFAADGAWHSLSEHVHLNTPGVADGWIDVSLDGQLVSHQTGLLFRTASSLQIDGLLFSTFFGGHDPTWAPQTDQTADFAHFTVASG